MKWSELVENTLTRKTAANFLLWAGRSAGVMTFFIAVLAYDL